MAYTLDVNLALGAANTGLSLEMQLKDTAGTNVGAAVTTGFVEFGATGNYLFHYAAWPDSHRGAAVFQVAGGGAVKAAVSINPQEAEFTDVKTSSVAALSATAVWASGTRTLTSFGTLVADTATAVWAAGTRTLTGFGTLVADVAAAVWSYVTRTLTMSADQIAAVVSGSDLTLHRGDRWTIPLTGLGNITTRTKLWFTVKVSRTMTDAEANVQIVEATGLLRLNGAAGTAGQGSITVTDATLGNITIVLNEDASALVAASDRYSYDVQVDSAAGILTLADGVLHHVADVTRAVA